MNNIYRVCPHFKCHNEISGKLNDVGKRVSDKNYSVSIILS